MSVIDSVKLPNGNEYDVMAKLNGATNGNLAAYDAYENLVDSGVAAEDVLVINAGATDGHIVSYDENGNIEDSGVAVSDVLVKNAGATDGHIASYDENGLIEDSGVAVSHIGEIDDAIEAIVNVYGSKNLLDINIFSDTSYFTINSDGSITQLNTDSRSITDCKFFKLLAGNYIISKDQDTRMIVFDELNNKFVDTFDRSASFTLLSDTYITVKLCVTATFPITIKGMICDARASDLTWVPYAKTNRELTEDSEKALKYLGNRSIAGSAGDGVKTRGALMDSAYNALIAHISSKGSKYRYRINSINLQGIGLFTVRNPLIHNGSLSAYDFIFVNVGENYFYLGLTLLKSNGTTCYTTNGSSFADQTTYVPAVGWQGISINIDEYELV